MKSENINYASYLNINDLLALQEPVSIVPDEMLFIIVHQINELGFKLLLQELLKIQQAFLLGSTEGILLIFRRCETLLQALELQLKLLATMKPTEFSKFRVCLGSSSGMQSEQFGQIKALLGLNPHAPQGGCPMHQANLQEKITQVKTLSLQDAFYIFLKKLNHNITDSEKCYDYLIELYQNSSTLIDLFEAMVDFDLALQSWRYQHLKLAERMIGTKEGTGGSSGIEYLARAVHKKAFPLLWQVRNKI